jgi:hypothetical protein
MQPESRKLVKETAIVPLRSCDKATDTFSRIDPLRVWMPRGGGGLRRGDCHGAQERVSQARALFVLAKRVIA